MSATLNGDRFSPAFLDEIRARMPLVERVRRKEKLDRKGREWVGICPFHPEKTPSFYVYEDNHYHCFGCEKHGDVIDYVRHVDGLGFREAVERLAGEAGLDLPDMEPQSTKRDSRPKTNGHKPANGKDDGTDWISIFPVPDGVAEPVELLNTLGHDTLHIYPDKTGRVGAYVARFEARDNKRKEFKPVSYGTLNGVPGWYRKAITGERPLYNLDKLTARPDAPVLVCEGEKSADAAEAMFPDFVVTTWSGGTCSVAKTDWTPLKNRIVYVWPDADAPGRKAAAEIGTTLPQARILRVHDLPEGHDAANLQESGEEDPEAWLRDRLPPEPEPPLPLLWFDDIEPSLEAIDFVQGVLTERGAAVVYGNSHAGKTFWTTDLALHIASGRSWNGRRVDPGGVIYCVLEGNHGFRNRVAAWKQKNPGTQVHFAAVPAQINLLDPDADTQKLAETIKMAAKKMGIAVKLVVIDTLSRALAGGNENAPDDMGALVMNMDTIRAITQANVLFVHHCGKDQAKGARGHSCLRAAIDTEIEVQSDEETGKRTATIVKQRDLDTKGITFEFRLDRVVLGKNQHGEEVSTCLVAGEGVSDGPPLASKERLTPTEETWFLQLLAMFEEANSARGTQPKGVSASRPLPLQLTKEQVRVGFKKRGKFTLTSDGMLTGADRTALNRYLNALRDKGKIGMTEDAVWLI